MSYLILRLLHRLLHRLLCRLLVLRLLRNRLAGLIDGLDRRLLILRRGLLIRIYLRHIDRRSGLLIGSRHSLTYLLLISTGIILEELHLLLVIIRTLGLSRPGSGVCILLTVVRLLHGLAILRSRRRLSILRCLLILRSRLLIYGSRLRGRLPVLRSRLIILRHCLLRLCELGHGLGSGLIIRLNFLCYSLCRLHGNADGNGLDCRSRLGHGNNISSALDCRFRYFLGNFFGLRNLLLRDFLYLLCNFLDLLCRLRLNKLLIRRICCLLFLGHKSCSANIAEIIIIREFSITRSAYHHKHYLAAKYFFSRLVISIIAPNPAIKQTTIQI